MTDAPLKLFNSLTRELEPFTPIHDGEARVYTCGPTVYNYQHIGNMRAYIFADTLGRTLSHRGLKLSHVINITDVGHLTSDADEGDDKMEKAAAAQGKSAWDIARYYQEVFEADLDRLNVRKPAHPRATDYVESMIEWGKAMQDKHCYELDSGLYFDVSTVPEYGRLARAVTEDGEGRIDTVDGKRNAADFAIWRKTPAGETRQMEWDSPWGKGAPGWHLECSVMSAELLGHPFDIHTGGIDHREIHHPNEIAQNQAHNCSSESAAKIWMHNNFLIDRRGKMSKSTGEFLVLQTLVDRGFHPLAYRMLALQAHYRSELEFTWEGLEAALTRLKRMVMAVDNVKTRHAELGSASIADPKPLEKSGGWTLKQVQGDDWGKLAPALEKFANAINDDLNTAIALTALEDTLAMKKVDPVRKLALGAAMDTVLGLGLFDLARTDLRIRPKTAEMDEGDIEDALVRRKTARADKDFATSDAIRDELAAKGVERYGWRSDGLGVEALLKLWRLTRAPYAALDGSGPEKHGARWTSPGKSVINFASEPGLAVLVVLRYLPSDLAGIDQDYLLGWTEVDAEPEQLPFVDDPAEKRAIGDDWLTSGRSLLASVQSAVLPEARVVMMNPAHSDFAKVVSLSTRPFRFEECLNLPEFPI